MEIGGSWGGTMKNRRRALRAQHHAATPPAPPAQAEGEGKTRASPLLQAFLTCAGLVGFGFPPGGVR